MESKSSIGKFGVDYFIKQAEISDIQRTEQVKLWDIFHIDKIQLYSAKLYKFIKYLKKAYTLPRKICVYTHDIAYNGAILLEQLMKYNGIKSYRIITSSINPEMRKDILLQYNMESNDDGSNIKILVFSRILAEGITFKSVRELHIFDSAWNFSTIDQVIGRVARTNSHQTLDNEQRDVTIYRYCAIQENDINFTNSLDYQKYLKSQKKDIKIKTLERMLMTSSFACNRLKSTNWGYFNEFKDGSRECQYQKCYYTCDENVINDKKADISTYNIAYHNPKLSEEIRDYIHNGPNNTRTPISILQKKFKLSTKDVKDILIWITQNTDDIIIADNDYIRNLTKVAKKIKSQMETTIQVLPDGRIIKDTGSKPKGCNNFKKAELLEFLFSIYPRTPEMDLLKKREICDLILKTIL